MKIKTRLSLAFAIMLTIALSLSLVFGMGAVSGVKAEELTTKKLALKADGTTGVSALQANTALTLGESGYFEMLYEFEKMPAEAVIDFAFSPARARVASELDFTESLSLYANPEWLRGVLESESAQYLTSGWGTRKNVGEVIGLQWINGDASFGANKVTQTCSYAVKYRVYSDGTVICYVANPGQTNWFATAIAGYIQNGAAWVQDEGINIAEKVFPTLRIRNCADAVITRYESAVYTCDTVCDGANFTNGTLAEGSLYTETFDESSSELRVISGTAKIVTTTSKYTVIADHTVSEDLADASATEGLSFTTNAQGQVVAVYDEQIALQAGQYLEATYDLSGVANSWFETKFLTAKPTDAASFGYETGDGILVINDGRIKVYSDSSESYVDGWGNVRATNGNNYLGVNYINGNGALGVTAGSDSLRFKARIYDDGRAIYYFATAGQDNWFNFAFIGWKIEGGKWVKAESGFAPLANGYLSLGFRNTPAAKITAFTVGVYDYNADAGEADGALNGEIYSETFGDDCKISTVVGTEKVFDPSNAISAAGETDKVTYEENNYMFAENDPETNAYYFGTEEGVTLTENQYVEIIADVKNLNAQAFMDYAFLESKPETVAALNETLKGDYEGMSIKPQPGGAVVCISSSVVDTYMKAWNGVGNNDGNYSGSQFVNGDYKKGAVNRLNGADGIAIIARYYADGSAVFGYADNGKVNWFNDIVVGWECNGGTGWKYVKTATAYKQISTVYPHLIVRNQGDDLFVNKLSVNVYDYTDFVSGTGDILSGALSAEAKVDTYGTQLVKVNNNNITINNANDQTYIYSRYTLPAQEKAYFANFTLKLSELSGAAKAVLYLGVEGADVSAAKTIVFSLGEDGKILATVGENSVLLDVAPGEKFVLSLEVNAENAVLIIGETALTLEGVVAGKAFALGVSGVTEETDKASASFYGVICLGYENSVTSVDFAPAIKPYPVKLGAPVVTIDENGVASWAAVENASGYKYVIDNGETVVTDKTNVTLTNKQSIKVMAIGDGDDYADGDYCEAKIYKVPAVKLDTPVVTIDENGVASWAAVKNASGYKYVIDDGEAVATDKTSITLENGQTIKVMAVGDGEDFTDSDYSEAKKYEKAVEPDSSDSGSSSENSGSSGTSNGSNCKSSVGGAGLFGLAICGLVAVIRRKRR